MNRRKLPGVASATKRLADGTRRRYYYAWRGGPLLKGENDTPLQRAIRLFMSPIPCRTPQAHLRHALFVDCRVQGLKRVHWDQIREDQEGLSPLSQNDRERI